MKVRYEIAGPAAGISPVRGAWPIAEEDLASIAKPGMRAWEVTGLMELPLPAVAVEGGYHADVRLRALDATVREMRMRRERHVSQ